MNRTQSLLLTAAVAMSAFALLRPQASTAHASLMADESIAVCSLPNLINDLMGSDRFLPDREAYVADRTEELRELNEQGREMSQRLSTMTPEDPGAQELFESVQRLREQIARKQAENAALVETFTATQLSECNDLVRSSARAVESADRKSVV